MKRKKCLSIFICLLIIFSLCPENIIKAEETQIQVDEYDGKTIRFDEGGEILVDTLAEAFNWIKSRENNTSYRYEILLNKNCEAPKNIKNTNDYELIVPSGVNVTIDLNGYTITKKDDKNFKSWKSAAVFINRGTLTIMDSCGGGKIVGTKLVVPDNLSTQPCAIYNEGGTLNITKGHYDNNAVRVDGGKVVISGGTFKNNAVRYVCGKDGSVLIQGGRFGGTPIRLSGDGTYDVAVTGGRYTEEARSNVNGYLDLDHDFREDKKSDSVYYLKICGLSPLKITDKDGNILTGKVTVTYGDKYKIKTTGVPSSVPITYWCEDEKIASVDSLGNVTFNGTGMGFVYATSEEYGNYLATDVMCQFYIQPIHLTIPTSKEDLVYDGEEQAGIEINEEEKDFYTITGDYKATNAGDYSATFTLKDKKNYVWEIDSSNTTTNNQTINWSIGKKEINVTADDKETHLGSDLKALTYTGDDLCSTDSYSGSLVTAADKNTVGTSDITQGTLSINDGNSGNNYEINFTKGTYTVSTIPSVKNDSGDSILLYSNQIKDKAVHISGIDLDNVEDDDKNSSNGYSGIEVSHDGHKLVQGTDYTVESGSVLITLKKNYLKHNLKTGENLFEIYITDRTGYKFGPYELNIDFKIQSEPYKVVNTGVK